MIFLGSMQSSWKKCAAQIICQAVTKKKIAHIVHSKRETRRGQEFQPNYMEESWEREAKEKSHAYGLKNRSMSHHVAGGLCIHCPKNLRLSCIPTKHNISSCLGQTEGLIFRQNPPKSFFQSIFIGILILKLQYFFIHSKAIFNQEISTPFTLCSSLLLLSKWINNLKE